MKDQDEAAQLRADLESRREEGTQRGRGYPASVRERVTAYMLECRKRRETIETVAERLGMSSSTLSMWMVTHRRTREASARRERSDEAAFAPVKVVKTSRVVLTSPSGWQAEIDLETLAMLVIGRR